MKTSASLLAGIVLALFAGCGGSPPSGEALPGDENVKATSVVAGGAPERRLERADLDAEQLARILGIETHTFAFSGGCVRCWLEIEDNGKRTIEPPDGVQSPNRDAKQGKIYLWWRHDDQRGGEVAFRIHAVTTDGYGKEKGVSPASYYKGLPPDALWWGWKGSGGTGSSIASPITPHSEAEVVLLHQAYVENTETARYPKNPRTVSITLKARFPKDEERKTPLPGPVK